MNPYIYEIMNNNPNPNSIDQQRGGEPEVKIEMNLKNQEIEVSSQQKYELQIMQYWKQQARKIINRNIQLVRQAYRFWNASKVFKSFTFFDRQFVYLVSKNWLEKWKKITKYQRIVKGEKLPLQFDLKQQELGCINSDIVSVDEPTLKFSDDSGFSHFNTRIKPKLKEEVDYQFLDQAMWSCIKHYKNIQVKRQIVTIDKINQKIVEVSPIKITLIIISNRIMRQIVSKKRVGPPIQTLYFSKFNSFAYFSLNVRDLIIRSLTIQHEINLDEIHYDSENMKFLFLDPNYTKQKVLGRIHSSVRIQENCTQFSIYLDHVLMEDNLTFQKQITIDKPLILCQVIQQHQDSLMRMCYDNKSIPFIKCPTCKKYANLSAFCKCRHITYCSQQCKQLDINHSTFCKKNSMPLIRNGEQYLKKKNGLVGLTNLGNTCFMNSGIQCLSHICELTNFFLSGSYAADINKENSLGTQGNLCISYCNMIKKLWQQQQEKVFTPHQFKRNVASFQKMFAGYQQHDSGEFITYLLDGLHEDLNRVKKKQYVSQKQIDQRPEKVIAEEQWRNFIMRNNSKIVQILYGQYRSQVDCPKCNYRSLQFDPFMMCSLPLVDPSQKLTILYQDEQNYTETYVHCNFRIKDTISTICEILKSQLSLAKQSAILIFHSKTEIFHYESASQIKLKFKNTLQARKLSKYEDPLGSKVSVCLKLIKTKQNGETESQHITNKLYKFKRDISFHQLHQALYDLHRGLFDVGSYHEMMKIDAKDRKIRIFLQANDMYGCWFCKSTFSRCKGCLIPYSNRLINDYFKQRQILSVRYIMKQQVQSKYKKCQKKNLPSQGSDGIDLIKCFSAFEEPQTLTADNSWLCPKCKQRFTAKKQMMIYKAPKVLILCLKRFKKRSHSTQKNHNLVIFPLTDLDLTKVVLNKQLPQIQTGPPILGQKVLYDLFAVCYHIGEAGAGHYTAACKNPGRNAWYLFDDQRVNALAEDTIVNKNAYILFYRRKM